MLFRSLKPEDLQAVRLTTAPMVYTLNRVDARELEMEDKMRVQKPLRGPGQGPVPS